MSKLLFGLFILVLLVSVGYTLVKNYRFGREVRESAFSVVEKEYVRAPNQPLLNDGVIIENRMRASEVGLAWPGYVAVYEPNGPTPGTLDSVLVGTSRLVPAGLNRWVVVDLVKDYKPGDRLVALIHHDDGDGIFNLVQDFPVKDKKTGRYISAAFKILEDKTARYFSAE